MTKLTDRQREFLDDIGQCGREVFAPNPFIMRALRDRGLIVTRLIGMRWWWVQPTLAGKSATLMLARGGL